MQQINLKINGIEMDIEGLQTFPLSITKQVDRFLELASGGGGTVSNVLQKLVLPATKNNTRAVNQFHTPNAEIGAVRGLLSISLALNGAEILNGFCILETAIRNGWHPEKLTLRVLTDGNDIWKRLDGVSVRDLDMGSIALTRENIINSQNGTPPTWGAIFAPVVYGRTTGQDSILPPPAAPPTPKRKQWSRLDFRPQTFFYTIIRAVFDSVGYAIDSPFIESDYFKRWIWLFGAGQDWRIPYDVEEYRFHERLGIIQTISPPLGANVDVQLTQTVTDPLNIYNNVTFIAVVPVSGRYRFEYRVDGTNIKDITFRITDPNPFDPDFGSYNHIYLGNSFIGRDLQDTYNVKAGSTIRLLVSRQGGQGVITDAYLKMQLTNDVIFGGEVAISSCLQDVSTKDFCRALAHQFGLNYYFDAVLKRVLILPRFDVTVKNNLNQDETIEGYYKNPVQYGTKPIEVDGRNIELSLIDPFGKSVTLAYKDDSDPLLEYVKLTSEDDRRIYATKTAFTDRGKNGKAEENPVFANLLPARSDTIGTGIGEHYLPFVLPSGFDVENTLFELDNSGNVIGELPDSESTTFESSPKCGIAYYPPNGTVVEFEDYSPTPPAFDFIMPACFIQQGALIHQNSTIQFVQPLENGAYANVLGFLNNDPATVTVGLTQKFQEQYFACIRSGEYMKAKAAFSALGVANEDFRFTKEVCIGQSTQPWILVKINGFKPTKQELTGVEMVLWVSPTEADRLATEHFDPAWKPVTHSNLT